MELRRSNSQQYDSIRALIAQIHHNRTDMYPRGPNEESPTSMERSTSERSVSSIHTLPILEVEKPKSKRSLFEGAFKIPKLTVTGPQSEESLEDQHRRFSFAHFRRHSHSAVRTTTKHFCVIVYLELLCPFL